jgi:riboflavin synthase
LFTGLIADLGRVRSLDRDGRGATVWIDSALAGELAVGDSVAVNGVCLTATELAAGGFAAEAMNETLERSSLGTLAAGSPVNLELALRPGDRLGGHVVQGHVDGTAEVAGIREDGFSRVLELRAPAALSRYLVEKGSVAVDGVSLTVSALAAGGFCVALIPETLERTNLGTLKEGSIVNIEVDILAKHIERLLEVRA